VSRSAAIHTVRDNTIAFAIALAIATFLFYATQEASKVFRAIQPVDEWFELSRLEVPSHRVGEDPYIDFRRDIKTDLAGRWIVETQIALPNNKWLTYCRGSGDSFYSSEDELPKKGVTLSWFRGVCDERPGMRQRLQVSWIFIEPKRGLMRALVYTTIEFSVYPDKAPLKNGAVSPNSQSDGYTRESISPIPLWNSGDYANLSAKIPYQPNAALIIGRQE